jgi:predicted glycosyltransferase
MQETTGIFASAGEFRTGGAVKQVEAAAHKKIWIDLDNSPHVPFFAPIIEDLERQGYSVFVTARDAYQVWELADFFHLKCTRVGRHYGKHKLLKVLGTCFRALQLMKLVWRKRPDLAVAHGSRSQTLASLLLRIPSVAIFDYEFVNSSALFKATWLIVPEIVAKSIQLQEGNILQYPGIKEDVYAPGFMSDPSIKSVLGLKGSEVVVTVRPPADEAHYHNSESDTLFEAVMDLLGKASDVRVILLPRNSKQALALRKSWPALFETGKVVIPEQPVDGLNLIWHSDLVISGGGTMNREAAALGVPVYSIFRGKIGAVDRYLADAGRMVLLESVADVRGKIALDRRHRTIDPQRKNSAALRKIVDDVVAIVNHRSTVQK